MDSLKLQNVKAEKANAISKYRKFHRITTLFRFVELFVFLIIVSRFSNFSFKLSAAEYFRGISLNLIGPQFVFVLGNVIVIVLFLISGQFSSKNGGKSTDFYEEYVEKCRMNLQISNKEEKKISESYNNRSGVCSDEKVIKLSRSHSENIVMARVPPAVNGDERCRELRRSMTERCRKSTTTAAAAGSCTSTFAEDEMSSEEFRRTVEAFIARQQRILREEEEFSSAVVSV